jgi:hypothetical protein
VASCHLFLFRFYIRELIASVSQLNIGCNVGGMMINVLAYIYADDLVLLAPSRKLCKHHCQLLKLLLVG